MPGIGLLIQKLNARIAARKDARGPRLEDWNDRGRDPSGDPVRSRPFCWFCLGTGATCLCEGCDCCPHCRNHALEA